jgi:hypothetical protein
MAMWMLGCGASIGDDDADGDQGGLADAAAQVPDGTPPTDAPGQTQTTVFAVPDVVDTFLRLSDPTFNYGAARACAPTPRPTTGAS